MRLQIQAVTNKRTGDTTTFTLKKGKVSLKKLNDLCEKLFPGIKTTNIKVIGGALLKLVEMMAMADRDN